MLPKTRFFELHFCRRQIWVNTFNQFAVPLTANTFSLIKQSNGH